MTSEANLQIPFQQKIVSFIGDADSGKSTLIGRYLCPDERTIQKYMTYNNVTRSGAYRMHSVRSIQDREGMKKIAVSHKLYKQENELVTMLDVSISQKKKIDCLMKAIWLSNICVLVIDVTKGVFEKDFNNSVGSIRTHLQMASAVGVANLVVCLTKCDVLPRSELNSRLEEITEKLKGALMWKYVPIIPVSCENDENIMTPTYEFSKGKSFFSVLRSISIEPPKKEWIERPLMMSIFEVYKIGGVGTVVAGKIISGKIIPEQQVYFNDEQSRLLKSIELAFESQNEAVCGKFCAINIRGVSYREIETHHIICDQAYMETEKRAVESFKALIKISNQPKNGIKVGYTFKLYYSVTNNCLCKIEDILHTVNPKTNQKLEVYPSMLKKGDFAEVRLKPLITKQSKSCFLDTYERNEVLGRVVLMNGRKFIGAGKVLKIN